MDKSANGRRLVNAILCNVAMLLLGFFIGASFIWTFQVRAELPQNGSINRQASPTSQNDQRGYHLRRFDEQRRGEPEPLWKEPGPIQSRSILLS